MEDIRWKQRFGNYLRAFAVLSEAVELSQTRELSKLEQQGLIQAFEFTHEMAWNVLKDYREYQRIVGQFGSRDALEAFKNGVIEGGEDWMRMLEARTLTSHIYHPDTAQAVVDEIIQRFYPAFARLAETLAAQRDAP